MSQALIEEIANLESREAALLEERGRYVEGTEEWRRTNDELNQITNRLSQLRDDLQSMELEQQTREQQHAEHLDELQQQIQELDPFSALFPVDYQEVFGLTEYGDKRQQLNQIIYAWITSVQQASFDKHNAELAERDAKNRSLSEQLQEAGTQWSTVNARVEALTAENEELNSEIFHTKDELDKTRSELAESKLATTEKAFEVARLQTEVAQLKNWNEDLRTDLANAPAPKPAIEIATSQSLSDIIAQTRRTSQENKPIKSSRELALEGITTRGKIELPALPSTYDPSAKELQFRAQETIDSITSGSADGQLLPTETPQGGIDYSFRSEDVPAGNVPGMVEQSNGQAVETGGAENSSSEGTEVSRDEFETLKRRVATLESVCSVEAA